jgi:hypothetical protein
VLEAGLRLARIEKLVALTATEIERSDAPWLRAQFLDEGDDWTGFALHALELDPRFLSIAFVRRIPLLADDALVVQAARVLEHIARVALDVRAQPNAAALRRAVQ